MLLVKSSEKQEFLDTDAALEWYDVTGKELRIAENITDTGCKIQLEGKQDGRKTSIPMLAIATVTIAPEVTATYEKEPLLKDTIKSFANAQFKSNIDNVKRLIDIAMEGNARVVNLSETQPITIDVTQHIERDDEDNVVSENIVAKVSTTDTKFIYSPAGVFDPSGQDAQNE